MIGDAFGEPRSDTGRLDPAPESAVVVVAGRVVEGERVLRVTISPSMPWTSVMWVTRRTPSLWRVICTMMSTAEAICSGSLEAAGPCPP